MRRVLCLLLLVGLAPRAEADEAKHWIVVTAPAFEEVVEPLVTHREAQGYEVVRIHLADTETDAGQLRVGLAAAYAKAPPGSSVLLVGAFVPTPEVEDGARFVVPSLQGTVGRMKTRPSDNGYGILDDDLMPDLAVGRFPARSIDEARAMVEKTIAFEKRATDAAWRNRVTLLVGHPGGSSAFERRFAASFVQKQVLKPFASIDPRWRTRALIHMADSPYCVPNEVLRQEAQSLVRGGQLFTVYLGHSNAQQLASGDQAMLTREDWETMDLGAGPGILLSCGCYTCQLSGWFGQGFGLAAIRNAKGPVAVIGAEGESYGAMGKLAFEGLLPLLGLPTPPTRLGDWWLAMKQGIATGKISKLTFMLYDRADGSGGKVPLDVQRREHLEMWMLLGDPALRMPVDPLRVALEIDGEARRGEPVTVRGRLEDSKGFGMVRVTLERPFGQGPKDTVVASAQTAAAKGLFRVEVDVPAAFEGEHLIVRARVTNPAEVLEGALRLDVKPSR